MNEQMMDKNTATESYKFLNALLDDYNACKTELARGGILKVYRMLLDKTSEDHLKWIEKAGQFEKELGETKAQLPKTKEEIANILKEVGLSDLEECRGGSWHTGLPSPALTPKEYAELYYHLYGDGSLKFEDKKLEDKEKLKAESTNDNTKTDTKCEENPKIKTEKTKKSFRKASKKTT